MTANCKNSFKSCSLDLPPRPGQTTKPYRHLLKKQWTLKNNRTQLKIYRHITFDSEDELYEDLPTNNKNNDDSDEETMEKGSSSTKYSIAKDNSVSDMDYFKSKMSSIPEDDGHESDGTPSE